MDTKKDGQELKFWNGRAPASAKGKSWDHCNIAAYSQKDAVQLYNDAFRNGGAGELKDYFSNCWGTPTQKLIPNPSRGIYLTDRLDKAVMFIEPKSRVEHSDAPEAAQAAAADQKIPKDYGILSVGFTRGINVDEWSFSSPHADRAYADKMKATVRLVPATGRRMWGDSNGMVFTASSACWEGTLAHSDIDELYQMVKKEFQTYELGRRAIVWEDWLEVVIKPDRDYDANEKHGDKSFGFTLSYMMIKRGVDPRDGKVYTLGQRHSHHVVPFPIPKDAGKRDRNPKTGKEAQEPDDDDYDGRIGRDYFHAREKHYQYAYIPKTKENVEALDAILEKMEALRLALAGVLSQKEILKQLAHASGRFLLTESKP